MNLTPEELVKANRFESLGLLAGGIAHDFNNLLTTILGGISLGRDTRDYSSLDDSEQACMAAKGLTRQLLMFAKGGSGTQIVQAPKEILADTIKIAAAGSTAVVTVNVADGTAPVLVDRAQMLQVFQNLVVNALQAMPPPPHQARLQLTARNLTLADGQIAPLPAGQYVEFEVRDNGSGIKPEHVAKIFDPFFTTKKHGTGLGLATVLSIVRRHGGQIGLDTALGVGTAFTVYLPHADQPVEAKARRAERRGGDHLLQAVPQHRPPLRRRHHGHQRRRRHGRRGHLQGPARTRPRHPCHRVQRLRQRRHGPEVPGARLLRLPHEALSRG